ncbi:PREDICTED: TMV resistance protein N-like [Populus euphratica]|uniref:ADP-ribosyl cyclase/cyclic ADP-ribose hydrolase n=1 Tax=Populus euphratica TaxID=75702 RepID=A0AAJ6U2G0_POPEU|nr:PREDICTED: TMV resistance protein N-like [Populus euphratica]
MASTSVQGITSSSSSSSPPPLYMHDVFLSFRGKDTRNNFTSHLYSNLAQRGIDVYMDDRELERGKTFEPALWKAIEESRFSVIVFSRHYASSPWCLDELVKIVQCMKEMGHTVLPVFYDVDPSEVAERKGTYEKAFVEHEQKFKENLEKVQNWKDCLATVANLSGWDVRDRNESESIKIIAEYISYKLSVTLPTISKKLVGIDSRVEVLNGYIGEEVGKAIFIGICGMGGIGKTTVARVVYDRIRWQFEGSCFLANVREVFAEKYGPRRLQEQLLSEILMERASVCDSSRGIEMIKRRLRLKKILLILDDVDDKEQLEFLAEEPGWFGPGSRIIITSRDKKVVPRNNNNKIYVAEKLNDDDALMLFSQKAFKNDHPAEDFVELSKQVVGYANGLPLALEVIGSFLYARSIPEWRSAINRMNEIPDGKIIDVLRISFDGLHESDKKIFLDIACFLMGFKIDRITRILESRGFHAGIGIPVLIEKSLISVSRNQVWMHNLLQIMGKEIVRCESPEEPGRRSRLWTYEDVCLALMDNTGKEKIEAIFLDMPGIKDAHWNMEAFSKMSRLRLLKIDNVQLSEGPEDLSKVLGLRACNLREGALPEDIGCLSSLRSLDVSRNNFVRLPRSINLLYELETLVLEDCTMLESLPEVPSKVQAVYLNGCIRLKTIPDPIKLSSSKSSEFICLNCWELYNHNGRDNMGLALLERYLKGLSNPRPGFSIAVPGNEIPGWFNHQSEGSSISVQVPSWSMGFVACVAFSANGESPLFCQFKANGRENYPLPMCISCNSIQLLSDHLWLFYLSFYYLKELKEWKHASFSNIELSFHSYEPGVKVKNCGVCLLTSVYITSQPSVHFIVTSKKAASLYKASLASSSSYHQWKANVFPGIRVSDTGDAFTYLKSDLAQRFIIPFEMEPEKVMAIRSRLFEAIEESELSIIIFARDCAYLPWCFEELVRIVGFVDEMRSDTVFPVSYDVKQSMIDDQTESYTIVFDKNVENFRENEEKVPRWMNILREVEILTGSRR